MCYCSSIPYIDMGRNREGLKRKNITRLEVLSGSDHKIIVMIITIIELQTNIIQNVYQKREKKKSCT